MAKWRYVCFSLIIILLAGCAGSAVKQPKHYRYYDHLTIPSSTVKLAANLYVPQGGKKQHYPAIIMVNSWGMDQYEYKNQAIRFANQGYLVLSYAARGWGQSSGQVAVGGSGDIQDAHAVVDWLIKNTPVDPKRIGMLGISYGGGLSLLAAEHDPRIRAVASMSGWTDLLHSFYDNDTPSVRAIGILLESAKLKKARLSPEINHYMNDLQHYRITAAERQWAEQRSPINGVAGLNQRKVSVYLNNNFQDILFNPGDTYRFYQKLTTKDKRLNLSQGMHASSETGGLSGKPNYIWSQLLPWFNHALKGEKATVANGIYVQTSPSAHYQPLPKSTEKKRLYPIPQSAKKFGILSLKKPTATNTVNLLQGPAGLSSGVSRFTTVAMFRLSKALKGHWSGPATFYLGLLDSRFGQLYLNTKPQQHALFLFGKPVVHAWVRISPREFNRNKNSAVSGQLIAYLFDVNPRNKRATLITYGPHTFYKKNTPLQRWLYVSIPMRMSAYQLQPGHYLALVFATSDGLYGNSSNQWSNNQLQIADRNQQKSTVLLVK